MPTPAYRYDGPNSLTYLLTLIKTLLTQYAKLSDIPPGSIVDSALSPSSQNAVQNRVIYDAIDALPTVQEMNTAISTAIAGVTGISFQSVNSYADLPATGQAGVIYLVPNSGSAPNVKDEYFWNSATSSYELFGTTEADLSGYVEDSDLSELTNTEVQTIWDAVFV